jgi:hypothetical protein
MGPKLKVIITGSTGMVGEGVLIECLGNPVIEQVLVINRRPIGLKHSKLKEILHSDFYNLSSIEDQLSGYDACYFCLGVSSIGMKEPEYHRLTYDLTMCIAQTFSKLNPSMTFCYVSGASTDSTEKGKMMWARVKGKTENALTKLSFKAVYNFRPAALVATKGQKNVIKYYKYFSWLLPIISAIAPNSVSTLKELALAMIHVTLYGYEKNTIEVSDIHNLASTQKL